MSQQQTLQQVAFETFNGFAPKKGPRAMPLTIDFSIQSTYTIDCVLAQTEDRIEFVQSIYIDNSANTYPAAIQWSIVNQPMTIPPGWQGYLPVLCPNEPRFQISSSGSAIVNLDLLSFPVPAFLWPTSGNIGATLKPAISGGLSSYRLLSAASTNSQNIKPNAGQLYGWYISNTGAAQAYLKIYDKASAPVVGTDTPLLTFTIPGATAGSGANNTVDLGIAFSAGLGIGITGAAPDNDTTAVSANQVIVNLFYY